MNASPFNVFLFVALPYVCLFTFLLMTIHRYRLQSFSYSSLSSQFLENKQHFWAVVPFHYGILVVTAGHLIAFLIPRGILAWNGTRVSRLGALRVPTLVLVGRDNVLTPPAFSRTLARLIRRARLTLLPGGHAFFIEEAERFNQAVLRFLRSVRAK